MQSDDDSLRSVEKEKGEAEVLATIIGKVEEHSKKSRRAKCELWFLPVREQKYRRSGGFRDYSRISLVSRKENENNIEKIAQGLSRTVKNQEVVAAYSKPKLK